ncbi:hypothetical protein C8A03DRAFT_34079 [Achaetomium macrosporum]|uniref:Uncharacterized protein n=1 Tax=Achaetomium macrosporum TaxID=79813 RepID=A0AAN7C9K9_9PEZI|nr:hypothetical protein C8A03DRAFT_34079 [Achaetomium macrosporum]
MQAGEADPGRTELLIPTNAFSPGVSQNNIPQLNSPQRSISPASSSDSDIPLLPPTQRIDATGPPPYHTTTTIPQKRKRQRRFHPRREDDWTDGSADSDRPSDSSDGSSESNTSIIDQDQDQDQPPDPIPQQGVYPPDAPIEALLPLASYVAVPAIITAAAAAADAAAPPTVLTAYPFRGNPPQDWTPEQAEEVAWWIADGLQCMVTNQGTGGREIRRVETDGEVRPVAYVAYTWEKAGDAEEDFRCSVLALKLPKGEGGLTAEKMGAPSVLDFGGWLEVAVLQNTVRRDVYGEGLERGQLRQGYASRLVEGLCAEMDEQGAAGCALAPPGTEGLFTRFGFESKAKFADITTTPVSCMIRNPRPKPKTPAKLYEELQAQIARLEFAEEMRKKAGSISTAGKQGKEKAAEGSGKGKGKAKGA